MIIRRTSAHAISAAAAATGLVAVFTEVGPSRGGGKTFRVKVNLGADREKFRKHSPDGRRVNAVCWHGFRDFFRALFAVTPDAIAKTALATYDGADGFEATYPTTAFVNVGSHYCPAYACDMCECEDAGTGY